MTLRTKTLIIFGITLLGLVAILYGVARFILDGSFADLEEDNTRLNVERVLSALSDDISNLDVLTNDWAAWDDTYVFIEDANQDYVESNLVDETFTDTPLNLMLFVDSAGQIVTGKAFDLNEEAEAPIPVGLHEHLSTDGLLLHDKDEESYVNGIVLVDSGPMLVAARPILTSENEGPVRGTLIMGRFLSTGGIQDLAERTHLSLEIEELGRDNLPPDFQVALPRLSNEATVFVRPLSGDAVAGYAVQKDIYGEPALMIRTEMPREIYAQGRTTIGYFIVSLVGAGLVFGVLTLLLLEKVVLARLARLSSEVGNIGTRGDLSSRVSISGKDELSRVANDINGMLQALQESETERNRFLGEQINHYQKMEAVGQLAGGVAHDFNNLLTPILGYAELGMMHLPEEHTLRADLQEIERAAESASNLTRRLLAFSRRQIIEPKVVNLSDLILDMDKMLRRPISEDIELVTLPAPDLGPVKVDSGQMEQVLINLVVNARDAMSKGGKIIIEKSNVAMDGASATSENDGATGEQVMLSVTDTGTGMTEEVKARIFEPFFTTKEVGKGTGIGLSTCCSVAMQSGGRIMLDSEPGRGTTFKMYLPRVEEAAGDLPVPNVSDTLPRGSETVLLVEDEPRVRRITAILLMEQGYEVLEAANGQEALNLVRERAGQRVDLLFTDVVMPLIGGRELAKHLSEMWPETKVLYTSGYTDDTAVRDGLMESGSEFLQKPFTPPMLAHKVRDVLEKKEISLAAT